MATQLLKLLADNRGRGFCKAEVLNNEATIYLYDVIVSDDYWGGVSALSFAKELQGINTPIINLRVNSPGGDVFAARAMESAIREHPSQIIAHIDGQAASAATYVALAANQVKISDGGFFMIHKAWAMAVGNTDDMLHMAGLLEKIDATLVNTYVNKTGKSAEEITGWMAAETWFTAEEAFQNGFVDEVVSMPAKAKNTWNLSAYANAPVMPAPEENIKDWNVGHLQRMAALTEHL